MNKITVAISVELKKLFHSKVPIITMLVLLIIPFIGGFFMFVLKDPVLAKKMGLISAKAQILGAGTCDWITYLSLLSQAISFAGIFVFGFVTSWIFGREYSDRTIKDLLALPISRKTIVFSKFIVIFLWCLFLSIYVFVIGLIVGYMLVIPGLTAEIIDEGFVVFFTCALLTILLSSPIAFFASIGRGYLFPLGFLVFVLVLSQIVAVTGYGQYFPWAVPALYSGVTGSEDAKLESISVIIVLLTSISGLIGTSLWWRYADQT